jgi:NOL1/NOP2/sun family putative RNA methylase
MQKQLGGEWERFAEIYSRTPWYGLRVNRLKITTDALIPLLPFPLDPVRWCAEGFTYPAGERPSKQLAYNAGLYYIQEPSAMLPAEVLNPQPGDRVLDLCAAPGGKSVQLAGKLAGRGLLVSNDVSATRSRALVKNLELAGVTNATVLNEQPRRLAERFEGFFDKILVDAPCSGEGMFRRDNDSVKSWAVNNPDACALMQKEILHYASVMLAPGGRLVYSTCTFAETEDEDVIAEFLHTHENFSLLPVDCEGLGISATLINGVHAARIWPHKADGEGHFTALLMKAGNPNEDATPERCRRNVFFPPDAFKEFCAEYLTVEAAKFLLSGCFTVNGVSLYRVHDALPDLRGLRIARSGWYMGDISKGRFTPSQALAMGLTLGDANASVNLPEYDASRYLRGDSITPEGEASAALKPLAGKPWVLVGSIGYSLGWARWVNGRLKNYLPAGWVEN